MFPNRANHSNLKILGWIEGDLVYNQYKKRLWGIEYCGTVFRNPRGTKEGKDEYFFCTDIGFAPFSLVK